MGWWGTGILMNLNPSELRMKIDVTFIFQKSVLKPSRKLSAVLKPVFSLYPLSGQCS